MSGSSLIIVNPNLSTSRFLLYNASWFDDFFFFEVLQNQMLTTLNYKNKTSVKQD